MNRILAAAMLAGLATAATAQSQHQGHDMKHGDDEMKHEGHGMDHAAHMAGGGHMGHGGGATIEEPGQGAFAAIAEIVARLSEDPETDWSKVDIDGLRAHLVDMDMLITHAEVTTTAIEDGAEFSVALTGPAAGAARRMVPAHAPVLAAEAGWDSAARIEGDRALWRVTGPESGEQIRALGFFGLMALGDHHRPHHYAMATGRPMH